jgi:hypothetical protein
MLNFMSGIVPPDPSGRITSSPKATVKPSRSLIPIGIPPAGLHPVPLKVEGAYFGALGALYEKSLSVAKGRRGHVMNPRHLFCRLHIRAPFKNLSCISVFLSRRGISRFVSTVPSITKRCTNTVFDPWPGRFSRHIIWIYSS